MTHKRILPSLSMLFLLTACGNKAPGTVTTAPPDSNQFSQKPLVQHPYTAAPAAKVFNQRLYIYAVADPDPGVAENTRKYLASELRVFSMPADSDATMDHGPAMHIGEVPWASGALWSPDVAEKNGRFYLYFSAKDDKGVFRTGVATSDHPHGPFVPEMRPMAGTYSISPSIFKDSDGSHYLYLGGIREGQLQNWTMGKYHPEDVFPNSNQPTLLPRIAKLSDDMVTLEHGLTTVPLLDETGNLINFGDTERQFYEAPWVHKYQGTYYMSWYSDTSHTLQYATSASAYGPFQWRGRMMEPVFGGDTHQATVEHNRRWFLFYHDAAHSGRQQLRNIKVSEFTHDENGTIAPIDSYFGD